MGTVPPRTLRCVMIQMNVNPEKKAKAAIPVNQHVRQVQNKPLYP